MNVRAAAAGLRIQEVPSFEYSRLHGASNLRIVADGWRVVKVILHEWSRAQAARRSGALPGSQQTRSRDN
jgi:hypothetical protein